MTTFCNKILFFSNQEIVFEDLLDRLEKCMMTIENTSDLTDEATVEINEIVEQLLKHESSTQNNIPDNDDDDDDEDEKEDKDCNDNNDNNDAHVQHNHNNKNAPSNTKNIDRINKSSINDRSKKPRHKCGGSVGVGVGIGVDNIANNSFVEPFHVDTLFWCLYIAHFGYNDYLSVERNYGVKELEVKKAVADYIKSAPTALKMTNYKITKTATQEILSDLLTTQRETNMNCLLAIICCFHINVIIENENHQLILEFFSSQDDNLPVFYIQQTKSKKYQIQTLPLSSDEIIALKTTKICLENYMKPMKPASAYKVADLEIIAQKLDNIDITKKYKKNELYDVLCEKLNWELK